MFLRRGDSKFFGSVTNGMRQRPEADNAQMNGTFRVLYRHMHYSGGRPAVVTLGAFV